MPEFISNTIQAHIAVYDDSSNEFMFLVLKRAESIRIYPGLWQVVTGRIEVGETAIETALREAFEETGLNIIDAWSLPYLATFFNIRNDKISAAPVFGFLVDSQNVKLSNEHTSFMWLNLNDAIEKVVLPTHKEGMKVFNNYILSKEDKSLFKLNLKANQ